MAFRSGESISRAICSLVNMKAKKASFAFPWQPNNSCYDQNAVPLLEKLNTSRQLWSFHPSTDFCHRIRPSLATLHLITSYQLMSTIAFCNNVFYKSIAARFHDTIWRQKRKGQIKAKH
jgi:hypothetical protein